MKLRKPLFTVLLIALCGVFCLPVRAQEIIEAAGRGDLATVQSLLRKDPQLVHVGDVGGSTALHWASSNGHIEVMRYLIDHGANVNLAQAEGDTPLISAAARGQVAAIRLLIQKGANLLARRNDGNQAIHVAAMLGHLNTVVQLISSGVDIDSPNAEGNTPLAVAAWHGQMLVGHGLISIGADIKIKNKAGKTAREKAIQNGKLEFANILDHYQSLLNDRALRDKFRKESGQKIRTSYANWANPNARTHIVYSNDCATGQVGSEWTTLPMPGTQQAPLSISSTPIGNRHFLGEMGSQAARLTLDNLPEHSEVAVTFDLFILRSWDGNDNRGPKLWSLRVVDGPTLLQTTFSRSGDFFGTDVKNQAYPGEYPGDFNLDNTGAIETNSLGYTYPIEGKIVPMDTVYKLRYTFSHKGSTLQLDFAASGLVEISDESWGITNIEVSVPIAPPPIPITKKPSPTSSTNSTVSKATPTRKASSPPRTTARTGGQKATTKKSVGKTTSASSGERLHDKKTPPKP